MRVSLVIPVYNECDNITPLYQQITEALAGWEHTWEILFVDDGSRDGTAERLRELVRQDSRVRIVQFRRNYGQTAAMQAGLDHADGDVIITLDGDLQNDPRDIPMMVARLEEGYDLVHGWRKQRHDTLVTRKIPSKVANWLISRVTRFPIHDLGCTLKAIRREIAADLELHGEMHRFIPILAHWKGARCLEVVTTHHPRRFGKTKYGLSRTLRVVLDLMTVKFLLQYSASPMKLFGMIGLACCGGGLASGAATVAMKLAGGIDMTGNPLLLLAALLTIVGVQFCSLGLLGEFCTRLYFGSQNRSHYTVRELVNFDESENSPSLSLRRAA